MNESSCAYDDPRYIVQNDWTIAATDFGLSADFVRPRNVEKKNCYCDSIKCSRSRILHMNTPAEYTAHINK